MGSTWAMGDALRLDHLVFTAATRQAGAAWISGAVGVPTETGGDHRRMGTHNALLRLGPNQYLEVIAIDPAAPAPGRPRWFEMDRLSAGGAPGLATWVARTADVGAASRACPIALGDIEAMSRGQFDWRVTIPPDGNLVAGGIVPSLIEWRSEAHPAEKLPDRGCSLLRLEGIRTGRACGRSSRRSASRRPS